MLDPFTQCLNEESAKRIIDIGVPSAVEQRVNTLAERANDGTISDEERGEYEALIYAADVISILNSRLSAG